eukprot:TRINITY_DN2484_c0_g1_i2.p3 TRINITY_DN2484_c0_g1~~TRINITY_DN2484_c0_g1_i2.p3  ORF type:complete len:110 (-),score=1.92 TRINITY_DN2484_c0_g1_i2:407-736(-)
MLQTIPVPSRVLLPVGPQLRAVALLFVVLPPTLVVAAVDVAVFSLAVRQAVRVVALVDFEGRKRAAPVACGNTVREVAFKNTPIVVNYHSFIVALRFFCVPIYITQKLT